METVSWSSQRSVRRRRVGPSRREWGRLFTFLQERLVSSEWATHRLFDLYFNVLKCHCWHSATNASKLSYSLSTEVGL